MTSTQIVLSTVFSGVLLAEDSKAGCIHGVYGVKEAGWGSSGAGPTPPSGPVLGQEHSLHISSQSFQAGLTHTPREDAANTTGASRQNAIVASTTQTFLELILHLGNRLNLA